MSWKSIRGHEAQIKSFARVVRRGRLAHAYLFTGPAGVGKRLFARELAKALLCDAPPAGELEACDRCPSCLQVEANTHPDFFLAGRPEESLEVPIDVVRDLCRSFALKPARGHGKVAILDDADELNETAANCFLKTLEEPPPGAVLLLIATSADLQLPTLVSRCQVVRFAPLPEALVAEVLRSQGVGDPDLVRRLERLSGGSPGQALALADPALWEFRRKLIEGLTTQRKGVGLAQAWQRFVEEAGKEASLQRRRGSLMIRLLIEFLTDALRLKMGKVPSLAEPEDLHRLQELADALEAEDLLGLIDRALEGDIHIERRVQLSLALEGLIDGLLRIQANREVSANAR